MGLLGSGKDNIKMDTAESAVDSTGYSSVLLGSHKHTHFMNFLIGWVAIQNYLGPQNAFFKLLYKI